MIEETFLCDGGRGKKEKNENPFQRGQCPGWKKCSGGIYGGEKIEGRW
jgi:hypothetical protein